MQIIGSKKGQGKQRQPVIAPDSAQSKTFINMLYGLGEGEILGLADGFKSVYLDDTPLQNDNGEFNFPNVKVDFRSGTNDQTYIDGFPDIASETAVGVELKHGTPWVKAFNNLDLDALRVRLKWGALRTQNAENGDVSGVKIEYAIDIKTDNGGWVQVLSTAINAKTSDAYERSHRIDLPPAISGWQVRVRRITPNSTSDFVSDKMYVSAITEVIDLKLRYPNTALLGLRYDAESFSNVAKMSARCKGLIIKVPTNYNPETRTYTGFWDGTFKQAYTNNPAWVYYDLCTNTRYGLGNRLTPAMIDKWSLYRLAQYCDQMVDDGMGGQEPRFTVNVYIQSAEGAFELLSKLAGVFRAISYWDGNSIVLDADIPQDSIYSFSRANVIDGAFEYTGTRARDRHTVAKVAWDNPANHFKTEYEHVRDEAAIAKFGVRVADIAAWGCTSRGQAQRAGLWALKSEQLETRMVTFKVGLDGYIPAPAKVIEISDELFAGRATGGRVLAINANKTVITLDRAITAKAGDMLVINGDDGVSQRRQISAVNGDKVSVTKPFGNIAVENVWVLDSQDLATMKFRVLSVTADDNHQFTITAVQYNPDKYDAIDTGAYIDDVPISVINPTVQAPTKSVNLSSYHTTNQGVSVTTLVIGWEQVQGAVKYAVEWRKDNSNWQALPPTGTNSIEITGVYAGAYEAKVTAISAFGQASTATHSALTQIQGKVGKPNRPAFIRAVGVLFGMNLTWGFAAKSDDTNFTEIQVSPDGRSNIATLGTFAYPTNKHEITGLQGNLTQFYRGRTVDKLGNTSDWTAWVRGVTDNQAEKVLNLISGQISESHLHQSLSTPIAKIGGLEQTMNGLTTNVANLNNNLGNVLTQINLEKTKLASAIGDINILMADKNTKTQEIANLTQTVNGHTGQMRDLAVTTGNLTQRYHELKTTTDTTKSQIERIEQATANQAISVTKLQNQLTVRPNLCPDVDKWTLGSGFYVAKDSDWGMMLKTHHGDTRVCLSPKIPVRAGGIYTLTYDSLRFADGGWVYCDLQGFNHQHHMVWDSEQKARQDRHDFSTTNSNREQNAIQFTIPTGITHVQVRFVCQGVIGANLALGVRQIKLEYGSLPATMYTQEADTIALTNKTGQITVNLDEFKQTQATKDLAVAQKIDSLTAEYKQADNALSASLQSEVMARTSRDNALTQRIDSLSADYNGNKANIASQLKTLSDKEQVLSQRTDSLNASFNDISARTKTRVNLLPNGGFENGFVGWNTRSLFAINEHPTFGRVAILTDIANKSGTFTLESDKFACEAGRVYTISADTALVGSGRMYVDLLFYNASNQVILDGNQAPFDGQHDFIVVPNRHEVSTQAPQGATQMTARFVIERLSNATYAAVRQIKVEVGHLPSTPYTADTLGKSLTASIDEVRQTVATQHQATASQLSTLQTTVQGQTASIQQHAQSLNGLSAQWTLKVQSGNIVSGIGLASNNGVSDFAVRADKFYIASPTGQKGDTPFTVLTSPQVINGVRVPAGTYIKSAFIQDGSIDIAKINKASIQSLSALSANIGHFKSAETGARLEIKDGVLLVYDDNNRLRVRLGVW